VFAQSHPVATLEATNGICCTPEDDMHTEDSVTFLILSLTGWNKFHWQADRGKEDPLNIFHTLEKEVPGHTFQFSMYFLNHMLTEEGDTILTSM